MKRIIKVSQSNMLLALATIAFLSLLTLPFESFYAFARTPIAKLNKQLIVRSDHNCPPYEFFEKAEPSGFNIELIKAVAETMGLDIKIVLGPWKEVRADLENGRIDVIAGMFYSEERDKVVDFSIPHSVVSFDLFVQKGSPIRSLADARDKKIVAQEGGIMHDFLKKENISAHIITVKDASEVLTLLASGQYDCGIMNKMQGHYFLNKFKLLNIKPVGVDMLPREYCFAVTEGNDILRSKLNEGLNILKSTGRYKEIYDKWLGVYEDKAIRETLKYCIFAIILIAVLLTLSLLWSWTLKKQVKVRTKELRNNEQKYRSIFDNAIEGIFQALPEGRYINVNPAMARMHGFASPEEMVTDITSIGEQLYVNPKDRERYRKLIEEHEKLENFEVQVSRKDGTRIWISINSRAVKDAAGKILFFEGTTEDITPRKQVEESLRQTLEKLRKSLAGTIQAMSLTVETKDPYTAGHQRRVSNLARAIAQEMNLSKDVIDNIRMAGVIHDIGKMSVPSEILSKPTKLTDIEMSLIKVHPQSGYDILKDVNLPHPIAEIVFQHHELLDGSGYPRGLKGIEILLEARIICVADVVEAIFSHRPYRPALGIEPALEEIERNKGILYDEKVVEVCLKLFKEKGFVFEPAES
jgi:PAS domain S-box-containing protein